MGNFSIVVVGHEGTLLNSSKARQPGKNPACANHLVQSETRPTVCWLPVLLLAGPRKDAVDIFSADWQFSSA
jgi:hypothetical protein